MKVVLRAKVNLATVEKIPMVMIMATTKMMTLTKKAAKNL
jgi:hypothetical protein